MFSLGRALRYAPKLNSKYTTLDVATTTPAALAFCHLERTDGGL
jgi:hypothetical protein